LSDKINENSSNNYALSGVLMNITYKNDNLTTIVMSDKDTRRVPLWLVIGVVVLIVLLLVWLTVADLFGDTDVAASVMPAAVGLAGGL
jgi:hypothetical protein